MCSYQQIKEHSKQFQSKWNIETKILSFGMYPQPKIKIPYYLQLE
jgi:hypothetical protein